MKKQIAVLMAAATAVTTVAPALAHAEDVNTHESAINGMADEAKKALDTKYKNANSNGITTDTDTTISKDDAYLNSRYIVLVSGVGDQSLAFKKADFKEYSKSAYAQFKDFTFKTKVNGVEETVAFDKDSTGKVTGVKVGNSAPANPYYVVDDAQKLRTLLEANLGKEDVQLTIVDKGALDGAAYFERDKKAYVSKLDNDEYANDTDVSLNDVATMLYGFAKTAKNDEKATYVESLKINGEKVVDEKVRKADADIDKKTGTADEFALNDEMFTGVNKVELELASGEKITLDKDDTDDFYALDFNEAKAADGEVIKLFDNKIQNGWKPEAFKYENIKSSLRGSNDQSVLDRVKSFEKINNKDNKKVKVDVSNGDTEIYTLHDVQEETIELKNIYSRENGYTQEGADFINGLINAKALTKLGNPELGGFDKDAFVFNFRGHSYLLAGQDGYPLSVNATGNEIVQDTKTPTNTNASDYATKLTESKKGAIRLADAEISRVSNGYKLTLDVRVVDANDLAVNKTLRFEIFGDKQRDLYDLVRDLNGKNDVVPGHFVKLAGMNRYETAISVSQEGFAPATAKSVVIVGGQAQLDGLSAAPLASAKHAPILLADPRTGLSDDTIREIARACVYNGYTTANGQYNNVKNLKNKTVYIVGGEKSVPASVEKQLKDKFGANVVRVSGTDRVATSLDVARRLTYDGNTNGRMFFVGAEGAADAMSVSAVAAKRQTLNDTKYPVQRDGETGVINYVDEVINPANDKVSPILVVPKDGLTRDIRNFLVQDSKARPEYQDKINNLGAEFVRAYLIGGENSLSTNVLKDINTAFKLSDVSGTTVDRIAGADRYATNVEVLKTFYMNQYTWDKAEEADKKVGGFNAILTEGAVFASGKTQYLVDAQTSGSFAANHGMPIVITDAKLTGDQVDLMDDNEALDGVRSHIYQVGGVVSADVMKTVVEKLEL